MVVMVVWCGDNYPRVAAGAYARAQYEADQKRGQPVAWSQAEPRAWGDTAVEGIPRQGEIEFGAHDDWRLAGDCGGGRDSFFSVWSLLTSRTEPML
jgi:hypothetical protein